MIELKNVSKKFGDKQVLKDVSVIFERGKTNLIIGQSGSGKTVLLKSIVGLHQADEGEILYDGEDLSKKSFKQVRDFRKKIGMLFQGSALFDFFNVEENVRFPLDMFTNMSREEKRERVSFCLNRVNITNSNHLYPSELSGGMQKRVAIARAIVLKPLYLFCDEPNSGLDPKTSLIIDNLIKEITEEYQMTTIVNTHDMNSVMEMGEKVVFIWQGQKSWEGTKDDITETNNAELNEFIFSSILSQKLKKEEIK